MSAFRQVGWSQEDVADAIARSTDGLTPGQEVTPAEAVEIVLQSIMVSLEITDEDILAVHRRRGREVVTDTQQDRYNAYCRDVVRRLAEIVKQARAISDSPRMTVMLGDLKWALFVDDARPASKTGASE